MKKVRVWDLPTRVFHWLLAAAVVALVVTAKVGGNWMEWHLRLGHLVLALLLFRVIWGLIGGRWSRFSSFLYHPSAVLAYLRGKGDPRLEIGHNPLGALSVLGLLAVLLVQVGTGLFSDDEIAFTGPLTRFVGADVVELATGYHKGPGQLLVIGLVVLHLLAIGFYTRVRRKTLVGPMLSGDKWLPGDTPAARDGAAQRALALVVLLACVGLARWVHALGA